MELLLQRRPSGTHECSGDVRPQPAVLDLLNAGFLHAVVTRDHSRQFAIENPYADRAHIIRRQNRFDVVAAFVVAEAGQAGVRDVLATVDDLEILLAIVDLQTVAVVHLPIRRQAEKCDADEAMDKLNPCDAVLRKVGAEIAAIAEIADSCQPKNTLIDSTDARRSTAPVRHHPSERTRPSEET